jgi:predicted nucleic acid-binding protein
MSRERFFLDTAYVLARVDRRDQYHRSAVALQERTRTAAEVRTTEAVLIELGNSLSTSNRTEAVRFIEQCYRTKNMWVVPLTTSLRLEALELYRTRPDKPWGLTDCISFIVMQAQQLVDALTSDHHFRQAGFRALLLEES